MEAEALTALNQLAGNPPPYPEKPPGYRQEALQLYIARVPGHRDVILSTYKPHERNLTEEDIKACLYYVRLAADEELNAPEPIPDEGTGRSSEESGSSLPPIIRKPVANQPQSLTLESQTNLARSTLLQPGVSADPTTLKHETFHVDDGIRRKSHPSREVPDAKQTFGNGHHGVDMGPNRTAVMHERTAAGLHTGMPSRKPVGPRPISTTATAVSDPAKPIIAQRSIPGVQVPGNLGGEYGAERAPYGQSKPLPVLPSVPCFTGETANGPNTRPQMMRQRADGQPGSRSPSPRENSISSSGQSGTPFTLLISRKDPSTGVQWNVAQVFSRQPDTAEDGNTQDARTVSGSSPPRSAAPHSFPPIYIELQGSGYAKFRKSGFRTSRADGGSDAPIASRTGSPANKVEEVFSRQMAMESSIKLGKYVKEKIQQTFSRNRSDSTGSIASSPKDAPETVQSVITTGPPPPGLKARGYVFTSPWDGKCEFRTVASGSGLICRHFRLEPTASQNHNPPVAENNKAELSSSSQDVSELRFDLYSSEPLLDQAKNIAAQYLGGLGKWVKQGGGKTGHHDGDKGDDAVSPLILNLGSERAGGGIRGRNVKLGKLIVHPEGLNMLDLVVAANMGLWWGAWEKQF